MNDEIVREFERELRPHFTGEIRLDRFTRLLYSTDASIYQIEPLAVLFPRTHEDVAAAVQTAARHCIPLLPRGGGTSLAGQTVGAAVVIDYSRHMNRVLETNVEDRTCRIQPGVVLDHLNAHLKPLGWQFGPDVSTSNRATLGGMMGNNSCGSHSILYGKTVDHVREMRVLLSSGEEARFRALDPGGWRDRATRNSLEGSIYRAVERLARENRGEIADRFPRVMRRVGGYNLDAFTSEGERNLCRMLVGSEGTLANYTEAVVSIVPAPRVKALGVVHFADLVAAMEATPDILELQPAAVELVDKMMLDLTRLQPAFARRMTFVEGNPAALLIVEFYGGSTEECTSRVAALEASLRLKRLGGAVVHAVSPEAQADVWAIRKAGLGLLQSVRGDHKPIAFVEDTAVEPADLAGYVRRFLGILERHGTQAGFYGHASVGCLHIRPMINLKDGGDVRKMADVAAAVKDLVVEFKGAMSGEHGDGLVRSHWNRELFGPQLYSAFREVKAAFDPAGIMNPGKIVEAPAMTEHLRYGPSYAAASLTTRFDFTRDGGMSGAIEQCNGMGACRKTDSGTMCPSYMATRDEEHSTRGRANALRAALTGKLNEPYPGPRLHEALDLCLECKACKTECPAGVDMAKLKYEFLAHYNARHGVRLRARVFAGIAQLSRLGSATAPVSNWILQSALFRRVVQPALGIHPDRRLPRFARRTFADWLAANRPAARGAGTADVILFNDTFTNYNEPRIGISALGLIESAGARVAVPDVVCCGRPMISKGLLDEARRCAARNTALLAPLLARGASVVACEPSCLLTLRDDYPDLLDTPEARRVAERAVLLEEYLLERLEAGAWRPEAQELRTVYVHGHCHQKSLVGTGPMLRVLRQVSGLEVREIDSGCCGMAGAFGYEREHYGLSMQVGELRLFPAVRSAPDGAALVASGTSCRHQIAHGTGRRAHHLAEILAGCANGKGQG
jgi:FAD/FMN-containing dehydrogenase/Fe-S oxidoreductase